MPTLDRSHFILIPWLCWAIYWRRSARTAKADAWRESLSSRLLGLGPIWAAALLLCLPSSFLSGLAARFVPRAAWVFPAGAVLTSAGLLFCIWARRVLGRNWSGAVSVKQGHELVTTGPYALVRHPIYSGLLLALAGTALALGEFRGLLAVAIAAAGFLHKIRLEEVFMREVFGDAYAAYAERVPALLPFVF
ncbi:phospholipid methyltransferase [Desulfovibrio sp. X2]|uniref:methyltransferase family protein n=1 Tax=Desulfovibrio sp. X2 TaxID=941449 RepID=UPI000358CBA0|nr:isoprenylcysteine carboxylmethyltransferase family protein [Desulfovibrio sp. X2]EPR43628.1 phospholipid methyltransferase [Desulfovibrio sp. X2]